MQLRSPKSLFRIILSFFLTITLTSAWSQTIRGRIRDSKTGEPMTGATIILKNTHYTTTVGFDGTFTFRHIPPGKYMLLATNIGYQNSKETEVDLSSGYEKIVTIDLASSASMLEEVQVTTSTDGKTDRGARRLEHAPIWYRMSCPPTPSNYPRTLRSPTPSNGSAA